MDEEIIEEIREIAKMIDLRLKTISDQLEKINLTLLGELEEDDEDGDEDEDIEDF